MNTKICWICFVIYCLPFITFSQNIERGPYLQFSTPESIIIKWRTSFPTQSKVWYGDSPTELNLMETSTTSTTEHEVMIENLTPNTVYYYAVGNQNGQMQGGDNDHYFKTNPLGNEPVHIWVLGDAGTKNDNQRSVRDAYYNFHGDNPIDMMLLLGDNAYSDGTDGEYQDAWFQNMYEDRLINSVMWSTFGNHDALSADSDTESGVYYDIFNFPKNAESGGVPSGTEAYYSFDYANAHVISLNSEDVDFSVGGSMYQWLEQDLAANDKDWTIAMYHHSAYSTYGSISYSSNTSGKPAALRENFHPLLEAAGVDLILAGHYHTYERSALMNGHYGTSATFDPESMVLNGGDGRLDGDGAYIKVEDNLGVVHVLTGAAGSTTPITLPLHPAMIAQSLKLGSVAIDINGNQMDITYVNSDNEIDDYFTIIKENVSQAITITNPKHQQYFPAPQNIFITTELTDQSQTISEVEFFANNLSIGTVSAYPFYLQWSIPENGEYNLKAVATDEEGNLHNSSINIQVGPVNVCSGIAQKNDDAEERANGTMKLNSSDLELVFDGGNQKVGLRFTNLNIPKGAIIQHATIQFTVDETKNTSPCNLIIRGEATDHATTFSSDSLDINDRPLTNAAVNWNPPNWLIPDESGSAQQSADIRSILQEIVNRPGYFPTSAVVFIIEGSGKRVAHSYNGNPQKAPKLCIEYTMQVPPDSDGDGTIDDDDVCSNSLEPGTPCNDQNPETFEELIAEDCTCNGQGYDCPVLQANVGTPCDDGNPGTSDDVILNDCSCMGTPSPFDCAELQANIGDACNDGNSNSVNDLVDENCNCTGTEFITLAIPVATGSDDAEERQDNSVKTTSGDLELIEDKNIQTVGIRFVNHNIPENASIQNAYIQFTVDETKNINPSNLTIYGEAKDFPQTFQEIDFNISSRSKTIASVSWSPPIWSQNGASGSDQRTTDLSSIIQELVNRNGYSDNSPLAFIIEGIGRRTAEAYEGGADVAPTLHVIYLTTPCDDSDNDGVCDEHDQCNNQPEPGTPCDDGDALTGNDMIQEDCSCSGTGPDCPNLGLNFGDACDDGDVETINDIVEDDCECSGESPPPAGTITTCSQIIKARDDAEEKTDGAVRLNSSDLELVFDGSNQTIGLRFLDLGIPPLSNIQNASIQFTVDETQNTNPCSILLFGELNHNPAIFEVTAFNLSTRPKTQSSIIWSPPNWNNKGEAGLAQQTVDLTPIIQEIVNQNEYSSNSAITLLLTGQGERVAESFNGDSTAAPILCIDYINTENTLSTTHKNSSINKHYKSDLLVFPNPAKDQINLDFYSIADQSNFVYITNQIGQLVYQESLKIQKGNNRILLDKLTLPAGIYHVQIRLKDGRISSRFVIGY